MSSKLLLDEYPLIILPELAVAIGLNEAVVLQQVHYWLRYFEKESQMKPRVKEEHYRDGRWWVYNSIPQWCDQFPFWSYGTIKRALSSLKKPFELKENSKSKRVTRGPLLVTANYNKMKSDKTLWYSILYGEIEGMYSSSDQIALMNEAKMRSSSGQNALMDEAKMSQPIPETTKDYSETGTETVVVDSGSSVICSIHNVKMKRRAKGTAVWYSHKTSEGEWCDGGGQAISKVSKLEACSSCSVISLPNYKCDHGCYHCCEECWEG